MDFTLADALQHYHAIDESVHRIWSYLGLVAAGLIAYVATPEKGVPKSRIIAAQLAFALFAIVNAVIDALAPYGVRHIDMPLRPEKVWRLMQN